MSLQVPINLTSSNGKYSITVPASGFQQQVSVDIAGAGGGGGGAYYYNAGGTGSNGRRFVGTINVNPGDLIEVYVGSGGQPGGSAASNSNAGGAGGWGAQIGDNVGSGILYPVTLSWAWSQFMNDYAVWVNPDEVNPVNQTVTITRTVNIPVGQNYTFTAECDNYLQLYIDGNNIINTSDFQSYYGTSASVYLGPGKHTIRMDMTNYGGPAGTAVTLTGNDDGVQYWNTRSNLNANTYSYIFTGGNGGNTYGDGGYVYPAPGGGGGATAVFVNGQPVVIAAGGGGGGGEGGHGAGGGGGQGEGNTNPNGSGQGENGTDGYDVCGTPGGGGGAIGGGQGYFIYYDDAPSGGAYAGRSAVYGNANGSWSEFSSGGASNNAGATGYAVLTFNRLGAGSVKVGGNWKSIAENYVKINNQWKVITGAWTKLNGQWKLISSNSSIPVSFTNLVPTTLTATITGYGSGGGGPNTNPGTQYSVDGNRSYYIPTYVPVSRHYVASSTGDSRFSASRALAFVSPGTNISAQQLSDWGFDPSDVVSATNISLINLTANVDSYLGVGYAILSNGATDFSQSYNITRLAYASDPGGGRHYHNFNSDANPAAGPWNIPNPGPNELVYVWIQDGSGSDSMTITVDCYAS